MQTLGHHLCADEDVALMTGKAVDDVLVGISVAGSIQIHPEYACFGEEGLYLFFESFGS